jgi:molybdate transport system substrate-binding protein
MHRHDVQRANGAVSTSRGLAVGVAVLAIAATAAGCGGDGDDDGGSDAELTVSAAASLTGAFEAYGQALPGEERFSFAGSDELAAQIRQGARPDVFASANTAYPEELAAEGLVGEPVVFARNELVIAVQPDSSIDSIDDLAEPDLDVVVGARGVPVGDYTQEVLGRLPARKAEAIRANVRSEESDVKGVIGKVAQGAADAGFVYTSDVAAAEEDVREVGIPSPLEPQVAYGIAVVEGAAEPEQAQRFVDGLLDGDGLRALTEAGFLPPR